MELRGLALYVPSLDEVVKQRCGKNLFFATDVQVAIKEAVISCFQEYTHEVKGVGAQLEQPHVNNYLLS